MVSRVCVHTRARVCVCVCVCVCVITFPLLIGKKILVVDWLFTLEHSRHFLRTNYVGAFALLIDWKILVDIGVCFMCL